MEEREHVVGERNTIGAVGSHEAHRRKARKLDMGIKGLTKDNSGRRDENTEGRRAALAAGISIANETC